MKIIYKSFYQKNKIPKDGELCLIIEEWNGKKNLSFGVYNEEENNFYDGIMGSFSWDNIVAWVPLSDGIIED